VPGLFAWQIAESSGKARMRMVSALSPVTSARHAGEAEQS
jgi:hypothetical protein